MCVCLTETGFFYSRRCCVYVSVSTRITLYIYVSFMARRARVCCCNISRLLLLVVSPVDFFTPLSNSFTLPSPPPRALSLSLSLLFPHQLPSPSSLRSALLFHLPSTAEGIRIYTRLQESAQPVSLSHSLSLSLYSYSSVTAPSARAQP